MTKLTLTLSVAAAVLAAALPAAAAGGSSRPHILDVQYYEDLEDGYRYNVAATIKGEPTAVSAQMGRYTAKGRRSDNIGPASGGGKDWFFRHRSFVRAVRERLESTGTATLYVAASRSNYSITKRCVLTFEPDPVYGDFAGSECDLTAVGQP
jgi:hypothetical protein